MTATHRAAAVRDPPLRKHDPPIHDRTPSSSSEANLAHFIHNHAKQVWACDFLAPYTAFFAVAYIFVIMEVGSRRIVHVNVTSNPTLSWVKQQIREATAWGQTPRFLVHDNGRPRLSTRSPIREGATP